MSQKSNHIYLALIFADNSANPVDELSSAFNDPREHPVALPLSEIKRKDLFKILPFILAGLFFILSFSVFSQCKKRAGQDRFLVIEGIRNGVDNYYLNLIIQDIALANRQTFSEISLGFEYNVHFLTDQCKPGQHEVSVLSVEVNCLPVFYQGFDIAADLKPEKADLVFHVIQNEVFISDSLIFFDIPFGDYSDLYNSLTLFSGEKAESISIVFSRAIFHFSLSSYEIFRDRILQIDQYYAAAFIADSARFWASNGFLSENGDRAERSLRQLELQRILKYIRPDQFNSVFTSGENDIEGLAGKYQELSRLNNRLKAINDYERIGSETNGDSIQEQDLVKNCFDWFDHYHELAFKADFRFVNFIEGLARPDFSGASQLWSPELVEGLIERGRRFEMSGNQIRALTYFESAKEYAGLLGLENLHSEAFRLAGRMKNEISGSYLEISRKSAQTENPAMAVQYYKDALGLFSDHEFVDFEPSALLDYENWLFQNFESQVVKYIDLKNYRKALIYLNEIQSQCQSANSYPCPEHFHEWMGAIREGIYHDLLDKASEMMEKDEYYEAEKVFGQAVTIRFQKGYRIDKDVIDTGLEVRFRQMHYENLIEEGLRYYRLEEFGSALYYLNKAEFLGRSSLTHHDDQLFTYRQEAARQIISGNFSDVRLKIWANDFEGAVSILTQVRTMLTDYQVAESDSLATIYYALEENVIRKECDVIFQKYSRLMAAADSAKTGNDYILAQKLYGDAVNLSLDHLDCLIRDDEAWYQKVLLETPANFQRMEKELDAKITQSYNEYLKSFLDLKNYYYRHKLLDQGVVFIPLFDRVLKIDDPEFLNGMMNNYISLKDFDHAFELMDKLRELAFPAKKLTDEQKSVAKALAKRDALNVPDYIPWVKLESYTAKDKWYHSFKWSYKLTWLKETKWKLKYWPFIWKK